MNINYVKLSFLKSFALQWLNLPGLGIKTTLAFFYSLGIKAYFKHALKINDSGSPCCLQSSLWRKVGINVSDFIILPTLVMWYLFFHEFYLSVWTPESVQLFVVGLPFCFWSSSVCCLCSFIGGCKVVIPPWLVVIPYCPSWIQRLENSLLAYLWQLLLCFQLHLHLRC